MIKDSVINTKMVEMLELSGVNYKVAIIIVLQWAIVNMVETNEKK